MKLEQAAPLISGRDGPTSGALWYAFYGWRGAAIFEGGAVLLSSRMAFFRAIAWRPWDMMAASGLQEIGRKKDQALRSHLGPV